MKDAVWVLQFDGSAVACLRTGGVPIWNHTAKVVIAQVLWFGVEQPTVNVAEMGVLEWGMSKLCKM